MKIVQDKSGRMLIKLDNDETYDIEEHLHALTDFVSKQAAKIYRLTNSYKEIVRRLNDGENANFSETDE